MMADELKIAEPINPTSQSLEGLFEPDPASGEDTSPFDCSTSCTSSSVDAKCNIKERDDEEETSAHQGYEGSYGALADRDNFIGWEGAGVPYSYGGQKAYYSGTIYSSGHLPSSVQYGSEAVPPYSWDSKPPIGDAPNDASGVAHLKTKIPVPNANLSLNSKGSGPIKMYSATDSEIFVPPLDSRFHTSTLSNNVPSPFPRKQPAKCLNKVSQMSSAFPMGKVSSFSHWEKDGYIPQNGSTSSRHGQGWAGNNKNKMAGTINALNGQNRGPRATKVRGSWSSDEKQLGPFIRRGHYNLKDFQTKYDQAVFFVIKSFSEDDVHKSIKYNVWASTPIGNTKLHAAFQCAEARSEEKGISCPIFLFFSVNTSGQFIGLAEMIGQVDFKKSMDFWQSDIWSGFFPLKWHIVKDIPSQAVRHIVLENNENKPVTNSRDTQEIEFSQGTEMLNIFKGYPATTSILDDFGFYEDREKKLQEQRNRSMPLNSQIDTYRSRFEPARKLERAGQVDKSFKDSNSSSLIALTQNLSLNPNPLKKNAVMKGSWVE